MADVTREIMWLQQLLRAFHVEVTTTAKMFCDNKLAVYIATNPVDCHIVRQQLKKCMLKAIHVSSENQLADILTKPLHPGLFNSFLRCLSLSSLFLPNSPD